MKMAKSANKGTQVIKDKGGRFRETTAIESPEKMWEYFSAYKKETKETPYLIHDFVGKDGESVYKEKEKPLTIEGFTCYLYDRNIIGGLEHYFCNTAGRYERFIDVCKRIRMEVRNDQIRGAMSNIYNANITARLNGLKEQTEIDHGVKSDVESMSFEIKRREK
jgi:hypothetical protein